MRPDNPSRAPQPFIPHADAPTVPHASSAFAHPQRPTAGHGEREAQLIRALIGAYDTFDNDAVRTYVTQALSRAGIVKVEIPAGTKFDPRIHNAAPQKKAAPSPDAHRSVASTKRPGWRFDNGEVIETPQVVVFVWQDPA